MKRSLLCVVCIALLCAPAGFALGEDAGARLDDLEKAVKEQQKTIDEQQKTIDEMKQKMGAAVPLEEPQQQPGNESSSLSGKVSGFFGGSVLSNPNISLVLDTYAFISNLTNSELENSGISGFTSHGLEQRNGFNLREAELFFFAPVDPYFNFYANIPITDNSITIEEAFAVTTALLEGLQVKGGKFKSNFSRLNAQHPHAWDFFDIALPYRAFMGDEGLGGEKGVQVTWLPELPIYTQLGVEALQGENDLLFGADARSGPHALTVFAKSSFEPTDNSTLYFGPSALLGRTKNNNITTSGEFDGNSTLYGMEAVWKWKPSSQESLILQSEYLYLIQNGDVTNPAANIQSLRRLQDGFYIQSLYQLGRWRFGARYDMLGLFSDNYKLATVKQDLGTTPWRVTGAVELNLSEFTRIRLQYNHDKSGRDGRSNEEGILQFIFGIGAHAAHTF